MKESFEKSLRFVLADEGGYVNDLADKGGETNMGISKRAYPNEDIKNITIERVGEIYREDYWDKIKGDSLPAGVDYVTFDSAVNHGPKNAGIFLQRAVNRAGKKIAVDGSIGPVTAKIVWECDRQGLIADILRERDIFYKKIIARDLSQAKFERGWMNRIARVAVNSREFV